MESPAFKVVGGAPVKPTSNVRGPPRGNCSGPSTRKKIFPSQGGRGRPTEGGAESGVRRSYLLAVSAAERGITSQGAGARGGTGPLESQASGIGGELSFGLEGAKHNTSSIRRKGLKEKKG